MKRVLLLLCVAILVVSAATLYALEVDVTGNLYVGASLTDWEKSGNIAALQILPFYSALLRTNVAITDGVQAVLDITDSGKHSELTAPYLPLSKRYETIAYPPLDTFPLKVDAAYIDIDIATLSEAPEDLVLTLQTGYLELTSERSGTIGDIVNITHAYPHDPGRSTTGSCGVFDAIYRGGCNTSDGGFGSTKIASAGFNFIVGYQEAVVFSAGALFEGLRATESSLTNFDSLGARDSRGLILTNLHGRLDLGEGAFHYSTYFVHNNGFDNVLGLGLRYLGSVGEVSIGLGVEGMIDLSEAMFPENIRAWREASIAAGHHPNRHANPLLYWEWAANVVLGYSDWIALDISVRGTQASPLEAAGAGVALYWQNMGFQVAALVSNVLASAIVSVYPEVWIEVADGVRLSLDVYISDMHALVTTPGDALSLNSAVRWSF